ncbi:hypothetical protein B0H34DRAFT_114199 [Crassisporium funariophilum]|nr:hypothetical protein B0H34DRAFT_114199 [Crassisporium funariophilum]
MALGIGANVKSSFVSIWEFFKGMCKRLHSSARRFRGKAVDLERGQFSCGQEVLQELPPSLTCTLRQPFYGSRYPCFNPLSLRDSYEPTGPFVDITRIKNRHRSRLRASGQLYVSPTSGFIKVRRHLTGDQLSNVMDPPEARGDDFRKWLLVMETLFPNRATYLTSYETLKGRRLASMPKKTSLAPSAVSQSRYTPSNTFVLFSRPKSGGPSRKSPSFARLCYGAVPCSSSIPSSPSTSSSSSLSESPPSLCSDDSTIPDCESLVSASSTSPPSCSRVLPSPVPSYPTSILLPSKFHCAASERSARSVRFHITDHCIPPKVNNADLPVAF